MSALDELRELHNTLLREAREADARASIVGRFLEEVESVPVQIEYDRTRLEEPPRPVQDERPRCDCGLPAEFKKSAPQNPKQWAAYFCARPKNDPKNCGYRLWLDQ